MPGAGGVVPGAFASLAIPTICGGATNADMWGT